MAGGATFEEWYRGAHPRLVASLTFLVRDRSTAEDIAAEACSRCLQRWDGGSAPTDPSAWTYTVAINLARRRWRRARRERDVVAAMALPGPQIDGDPELELWRAVAALPDRQRLAVVLRYVGGLPEAEVAEVMGVARGTVAATLSKAREKLAQELRAVGVGPADEAPAASGPTGAGVGAGEGRAERDGSDAAADAAETGSGRHG